MSKLRRGAALLLLVTTVSVSSAYGDEGPHNNRRDRSVVRQLLVWIMDQLTSPPA